MDDIHGLLPLADSNLAEFGREHARWLPPTRIDENECRLFTASGTRFPAGAYNAAFALGGAAADPEAFLDEARAHYRALARGFSVYTRGHLDGDLARACERRGYLQVSSPPGMVVCDRAPARELRKSETICTVETEAQALAFIDVVASAYEALSLPAAVTRKLFSEPKRWLTSHWHTKVLYDDERPVSAGMVLFSHGIAGVYWVGTVPDARGRGHADAVMRALGNDALDRGARAIVLQASQFGEPVYRRLGYREFTRYPWYVVTQTQCE